MIYITIKRAINLFKAYFFNKKWEPKNIQNNLGKKESPIFIVGCERTGTTLLLSSLNKHNDVAICPETHFFMDSIDKKCNNLLKKKFEDLEKVIELKKLLSSIKYLTFINYEKYDMALENLFEESELLKIITSDDLFKKIIEKQAQKRKAKRFGEKTPGHIFYTTEIKRIYPKALIIQMIRDPRAVVFSRLKKPRIRAKNIIEELIQALFASIEWKLSTKLYFLNSKRFNESYKLIKYEELIKNPKEIIQELCEFIDLDFQNQMLDIKSINSSFDTRRTKGFNINALNRWEKNLPDYLQKMILNITKREMEKIGYIP